MATEFTDPALLDRLTAHKTLGSAPRKELEWLAAHGKLLRLAANEMVVAQGQPSDYMYVIFTGHTAIYVDRGGGPRKLLEWFGGDVAGLLPYSRMRAPPGDSMTDVETEVLAVHRDCFTEMTRECPHVTATTVHLMLDRARHFTSSELQDEKMVSLGKLSAGLAHELNNPASAAARSAKLLEETLTEVENASRALRAAKLTDEQYAAVDAVRGVCVGPGGSGILSPLERADRVDQITEWLESHGADSSAAGTLAETPITVDALDKLAQFVSGKTLDAALDWIAAGMAARTLATEVERAASRIHELVSRVKRFTYMDRASLPEDIDISQGLGDAVGLHASKARSKNVEVALHIDPSLPKVRAVGGELNQIWANLVDNAINAVEEGGHVEVSANVESGDVVVRVVDNGPGIPADVVGKIFDPFFTTKTVGKGMGLGLDIVRRIVRGNKWQIYVESVPGRTEFRLVLG